MTINTTCTRGVSRSPKSQQKVLKYSFENGAYLRDSLHGIYTSNITRDGPLQDTIEGVSSVFDFFKNSVRRQPDEPFLGFHETPKEPFKWMTYAEVNKQVEQCAAGLVQRCTGVDTGSSEDISCVGIFARNSPRWLITELACWHQGIVVIPLYDTLSADSMKHICNQAELSVVVCDTPDRARKLLQHKSELRHLRHIVMLSDGDELKSLQMFAGDHIRILTFDELLVDGTHASKPQKNMTGDDICIICYTSGTTGLPKGAVIRNKNMIALIAGASKSFMKGFLTSEDTTMSFLPLAHVYEQSNTLTAMYIGAKVGYCVGSVAEMSTEMQLLKPTIFTVVPRLLSRIYEGMMSAVKGNSLKKYLLDVAAEKKLEMVNRQVFKRNTVWDKVVFSAIRKRFGGRIRFVMSGGAPLAPHILRFTRALFSCPVVEGYGCTETCGPFTCSVAGDLEGGHVGSPLVCAEVRLADVPDMGLVAARDNTGEICVRGANCIDGYYKNPEDTAKLIDSEGWLHTGDVGRWINGCLKVVDRCKHIFKLAQGEYVAPEVSEQVYAQCDLVEQIFVDGDSLHTFPVALVVPNATKVNRLLAGRSGSLRRGGGGNRSASPGGDRSLEDLCGDPAVKKAILDALIDVDRKSSLKGFEKVKNIKLISEPFSIENNLLTPTLKAARLLIRKRYSEDILQLYKEVPVMG